MSRDVDYPERPISEQLVDLHIYMVPPDLWRDHLNSAINQIINDTVSAGFIRVLPESTVYNLREELEQQLGFDILPREYVFLKSVGRCLTRIRPKQEFQLKVKNFLPPLAYVPEIFLLEASSEYLSSYPSSGAPSGRNSRHDTTRSGLGEFNPHKPVPPIRNSVQGSVRNGHGVPSTTGTQTGGTSFLPSPPLTMSGFSLTSSPLNKIDPLPPVGQYNSMNTEAGDERGLHGQSWGRKLGQQKKGETSEGHYINQLTPVSGSTSGTHVATQTPVPGINVISPTNTYSPVQTQQDLDSKTVTSFTPKHNSNVSNLGDTNNKVRDNSDHDSVDLADSPTTTQRQGNPQVKEVQTDLSQKYSSDDFLMHSPSKPLPSSEPSVYYPTIPIHEPPGTPQAHALPSGPGGTNQHRASDATGEEDFEQSHYAPYSSHPHGPFSPKGASDREWLPEGPREYGHIQNGHSDERYQQRSDGGHRSDQVHHSGAQAATAPDGVMAASGNTSGTDTKNINNTSDDSGFSEMEEAERRKTGDKFSRQTGYGKPSQDSIMNGTAEYHQREGSRRKDLEQLEQRRQQVLQEESRQEEEEAARLDEDRRKWANSKLHNDLGSGETHGPENGWAGSPGEDEDNDEDTEDSKEVDRLLEQHEEPPSSPDPVDQAELMNKLTEQLEKERLERHEIERRREVLVKRAKSLQNKTQQRRTLARDIWKKKYFEEKKKTNPLEEQTNRLRQELESLHRRIMSQLEGSKDKDSSRKSDESRPSMQSNLKIQATRMQHEIEDLQRRVENVKMKLTSEMKLRNQAETELRALRAELTQKKINISFNRSKQLNVGAVDLSPQTPIPTQR